MSDISYTATSVRPIQGYVSRRFNAGGSIYAGQGVYVDSGGSVQASDCDAGSLEALAIGVMIADNDGGTLATSGDVVDVVVFGCVTGYSSMTPGALVFASTTAGGLVQGTPSAGSYVVPVGIAFDASTLFVNPCHSSAYVTKS